MIRLLQTKWMALALGAVIYSITTWLFLQPQKLVQQIAREAKPAKGTKQAVPVSAPSWSFDSPEMSQVIAELKDQQDLVKLRAQQLDELEARLHAERQEIYAVTQEVYRLKTNLDSTVTRISEEEAANLKRLVKVYTVMTPEGAARILREMDDDQIVRLMAVMREAESAPILEAMGQGAKENARRAAMVADRLRVTVTAPKSKKATP